MISILILLNSVSSNPFFFTPVLAPSRYYLTHSVICFNILKFARQANEGDGGSRYTRLYSSSDHGKFNLRKCGAIRSSIRGKSVPSSCTVNPN